MVEGCDVGVDVVVTVASTVWVEGESEDSSLREDAGRDDGVFGVLLGAVDDDERVLDEKEEERVDDERGDEILEDQAE